MPNLPRPLRDSLSTLASSEVALGRRPVPARVERAVNTAVAIEHGRGIVGAARVRALGYVTDEAMEVVGHTAKLEEYWSNLAPRAVGRLQAIADIAAIQAADIVADMGRE